MATKKYVVKSFKPGTSEHNKTNALLNLSKLGINSNSSIMKASLGLSTSLTQTGAMQDLIYPNLYDATGQNQFAKYKDLTKNQSSSYAFFDMTYQQRRQFCILLARDRDIGFVVDTICDQAIVPDSNGYCAQLDLDRLKLFLNKGFNGVTNQSTALQSNAEKLIRDCKISYNTVYSALGWDDNSGAWQYFRKYLIEGYLTLEILLDESLKNVVGFLELDPITLQPDVIRTEDGEELFIWYQFKGESRQRIIPDSRLIYISWNQGASTKVANISYVESLSRSFNMLKQLEDSQLIWNIQNAQKRMKITIPVGDLSPAKAEERISEIMADYNEEVSMDAASGLVLVNGEPKFPWTRTYFFEDRNGKAIQMEAVSTDKYDMTTESLQYFWRKYILDTGVPANRFLNAPTSAPSNQMLGDANVTREEYAFGKFIDRLREQYRQILVKPLWVQICLKHPELSKTEYLKQGLGIKFNDEDIFTLAKQRAMVNEGASTVSTLLGIMGPDQKSYFSIDFVIKKYLGLTDQDLELNRKYKEAEVLRQIELAALIKKHLQEQLANTPNLGNPSGAGGMDMGGGDFGGGMGGSDFGGGDMGGGPDIMDGGEFGGPEPDMGGPEPDMGGGTEPDMGGDEMA